MKKLALASILAIAAISTVFAQPTLQWDKRFNGGGNDQGNDLVVDGNGNVYVTGTSDGANFASDYFTIKYNSNGDTLWTRRFNGTANGIDEANSIKVDPMGNVYVTGKSATTTTGYNIVTIKYNASGAQQWVANFDASNSGSNKDDIGLNMLVDIAGNVYVVGSSIKPGNSQTFGIVIKYNASGAKQWHTHLGNSTTIAKLIKQNTFGNIIVPTGREETTSYYSIYVVNPANGNVLQTYNQDFDPVPGHPEDMVLDPGGNIYLTSTDYDFCSTPTRVHTAKFSYVAPPQNPPSHSWDSWTYVSCGDPTLEGVGMKIDENLNLYVLSDYFNSVKHSFHLKKYNPNGGTYWSLTQPSSTDDTPISLVLGRLSDPGSPDLYVTGNTSTGLIKTTKYENDSTWLWSKTFDCGNGIASAARMVVDDCDNIYITGFSTCNGTYKDIIIIKYSALTATITPNGPTTFCQGGSVTLTSSPANSYNWSNGATTQSITASSSGVYSVTITNANQCTAASSGITVLVNPIPIVTVNSLTICAGQQAILTANGAATYLWNTGATTSSITVNPMATTTYSVTGTTANCASAPASAQVTVNSLPTVTVNSPTICAGQQTTLTANGATAYLWNTGATTSIITVSPNSTTTYTVTGTSAMCSSSATAQVFANPLLTPSVSILGPSVLCLGQNATYTATPTNGGPSPTYEWFVNFVNNTPVGTGPTYSTTTLINGDQIYCVLTSNAACLTTNTSTSPITTVTVLPLPNVQITPSGPTTFCAGGSVTLMASPTGNYLWSTGATTKNIPVSTGGVYIVTVTVASGCSAVSTPTTVTVKPPQSTPMIIPTGPIPLCPGEEVELTSTFANAYLWNTGETTQSITVSILGDYSVTVTNQDSCSAISPPTSVQLCVIRVSETNLPEGFNISPNPSAGLFTVKFFLPEATIVAQRVLNVLGQVVWTAAPGLESGEYHREIDLGRGVTPGIYFLETRLDGRAFLRKVEVR